MAAAESNSDPANQRLSTRSNRMRWIGIALAFPSMPTREYKVYGGNLTAADVAEIEWLVST
jgi:hypothetical protein